MYELHQRQNSDVERDLDNPIYGHDVTPEVVYDIPEGNFDVVYSSIDT